MSPAKRQNRDEISGNRSSARIEVKAAILESAVVKVLVAIDVVPSGR